MDERTFERFEHYSERLEESMEYVEELVLELNLLDEDSRELGQLISVFNITLREAINRKKAKEDDGFITVYPPLDKNKGS